MGVLAKPSAPLPYSNCCTPKSERSMLEAESTLRCSTEFRPAVIYLTTRYRLLHDIPSPLLGLVMRTFAVVGHGCPNATDVHGLSFGVASVPCGAQT